MAVLWCGGEDIDFPNGTAPTVSTAPANFRAGYARCTVFLSGVFGIAKSPTLTPFTSCWLSARAVTAALATSNRLLGLGKSGTNSALFLGCSTTNLAKLALIKWDAGVATQLATESATSLVTTAGVIRRFDIQLISYGVSGTVNVYVDGVLVISFTGDLRLASVTNLDQVWLASAVGGTTVAFSELILADEDLRGWLGLVTLAPNALGTTNAWSNTAFTNVNPTTINDLNATFTNTTTQDNQYNLIDPPASIYTVAAVKIAARALSTAGAAAPNISLGFKNGATTAVAPQHATTVAFATYEDLFATDPTTGAPWVGTDLTNLQIDLRSA